MTMAQRFEDDSLESGPGAAARRNGRNQPVPVDRSGDRGLAALFGWHPHSDYHFEVQVLAGSLRLDLGREARHSFEGGPGDLLHIPHHLDPPV